MEKIITYTYVAEDGKEFEDEKECKEYEKRLNTILRARFYDEYFNKIDNKSIYLTEKAYYAYFEDEDSFNAFNDLCASECTTALYVKYFSDHHYMYDTERDNWIDIDNEIEKYQRIIKKIKD